LIITIAPPPRYQHLPVRGFAMPAVSKPPRRDRRFQSFLMFLVLFSGCVVPQMVRCPMGDADLTKHIFEIAPKGTPRNETIAKLRAAGIDGSFAPDKSTMGKDYYCCQSWRRPDGEVWKISMLLHFDKAGNFVETLEMPNADAGLKPAKTAS
jgi:hypothetical protein